MLITNIFCHTICYDKDAERGHHTLTEAEKTDLEDCGDRNPEYR
jgi:hypothetical protein